MDDYEVDLATLYAAADSYQRAVAASGLRGVSLTQRDDYGHVLVETAADDFMTRWTTHLAQLVTDTGQLEADLRAAAAYYARAEAQGADDYRRAGRRFGAE